MKKNLKQSPPDGVCSIAKAIASLSCTHFGNHSEIDSLIQSTGKWETIAVVYPAAGLDAEDIASFIIMTIEQERQCGFMQLIDNAWPLNSKVITE